MILISTGNNSFLSVLKSWQYMASLRWNQQPSIDAHFSMEGTVVTVEKFIVVELWNKFIDNCFYFGHELIDIIMIEFVLKNYLIFLGDAPIESQKEHAFLQKATHLKLL